MLGAFHALARTGAPSKVIGVIPAVENMPSGSAFRPGDVLTGASGLTVEITNTDAEGRLILGDGLWYARQLGATHLVDIATLTGACAVALGRVASGLFGSPDTWRDAVQDASTRGGDFLWPLPMTHDYKDLLKSDIADMVNAASARYGGAISAALFLKAFIGDTPWAHLDIAGTAWADESKPWQAKGPTGVAVRPHRVGALVGELGLTVSQAPAQPKSEQLPPAPPPPPAKDQDTPGAQPAMPAGPPAGTGVLRVPGAAPQDVPLMSIRKAEPDNTPRVEVGPITPGLGVPDVLLGSIGIVAVAVIGSLILGAILGGVLVLLKHRFGVGWPRQGRREPHLAHREMTERVIAMQDGLR